MGVVHQEQERPVVLRQVAERDVLAVAAVIGKAERPLVDRAEEALRPAAVLGVRLSGGAGGREIGRVDLCEEGDEVGGDEVLKPPDASRAA